MITEISVAVIVVCAVVDIVVLGAFCSLRTAAPVTETEADSGSKTSSNPGL
jgi:hypothetical protein